MRLKIKKHNSTKLVSRLKKKARIRSRIEGSTERPRLCIFRSSKHIYAQVIDDAKGVTLAHASTMTVEGAKGANKKAAHAVGVAVAKIATQKNVKDVVFDRNGYLYHGRIQALADGAREGGLNF